MLAMVIDSKGNAAKVELDNLKFHQAKECLGILAYPEEGGPRVIKPLPDNMFFPHDAPTALILKAQTKYGVSVFGEEAIVWEIGMYADNGFSIPAEDVVDKCYVRVFDEKDSKDDRKFY